MKILKIMLTMLAVLAGFNAYALPITVVDNSSFTIDYDAIGGDPVAPIDGLSASVDYYDFLFAYDSVLDQTELTFTFDVRNTSVNPILTSRVSTIGFDTTPDILGASVSGVYNAVNDGNVPNQGVVEFCFTDVGCAGGGSGGVDMIQLIDTGWASLIFTGNVATMDFDNFTVRYQSVTCEAGYTGNCPGSASGSVTVPEPGMVGLLAIGLMGVVVARRKMKV